MALTELRNATRRLAARPGYSALAIAVLGFGLGAALFLLATINGIVLRPLPFPDADRLVVVGTASGDGVGIGTVRAGDLVRLRDELRSLERIGVYDEATAAIARGGDVLPRRYHGTLFSQEMFGLLGVTPMLGRAFTAEDDHPGAALTLLLSERVWRSDFDADPDVLGRTLVVNGEAATVVGVMPPGFAFPALGEVWLPRRLSAEQHHGGVAVARLAPGVGLVRARAELEAVMQRLGHELSIRRDDQWLDIKPLTIRFVNEATRNLVWMMFAAGVLVLLLACANVANLQLAMGMTRRRELSVRSALGASRGQLLRALLAESLLLSLAAVAIGLAFAHFGGRWLIDVLTIEEEAPPYFLHIGIDANMIAFALAAALLTTLLAGLAPALQASRVDVQDGLRDGARGAGGGFARFARGLVVAEVALCVVLLVGAGMFIRGLQSMLQFDFGTRADPAQVLTGRVGVFPQQFATAAERLRFYERVVERLQRHPDVLAASAANALPGTMAASQELIAASGEARPHDGWTRALYAPVDGHFADAYAIGLVAGRFFDGRDRADSQRVAVVDTRTASALWPGRDPLGQTLLVNPQRGDAATALVVVGVVEAMHLEDADDPVRPTVLVPLAQQVPSFVTLAVRLRGDALAFAPELASAVRAEHAEVPVYWVRTQLRAIETGRIGPVVLTRIFSAVGLLALVLAAAGLYGVLAFAVEQRTREIGIRRAIGAGDLGIAFDVSRRVLWQVGLGVAIGLLLAWPWSAVLDNPDLHVRGHDPLAFAGALVVLLAVAAVASLAPVRRALRVDPIVALRHH
jgi:putative ABC transport system permease protein